MKSLKEIITEIQDKRGNPILMLDIKELRKVSALKVQELLLYKQFKFLDIILQTPGGDIDTAFVISKIIKKSAEEINVIVPLFAKSAGTLLCLIADKILMTEVSELGPLDTQIQEEKEGDSPEYHSALNGFKALEQVQQHTVETLDITTKLILTRTGLKMAEAIHLANEFAGQTSGTLYTQLNPMKIGEYARALEIGQRYGEMLLTRFKNWTDEKAHIAIHKLVYEYPSHGFVIDYEEINKIGFVAEKIDETLTEQLCTLRELLLKNKTNMIELYELENKNMNSQSQESTNTTQ